MTKEERKPTFLHRIQYVAWRLALAALGLLPWGVARRFGEALGKLGYFPFRIRRKVVDNQIAAALPELSDAERRRISHESYASLGRLAVEAALVSSGKADSVLEYSHDADGWEHLAGPLSQGRGVILVSGHLGNWELGLGYIAARGVKLSAVVRQMTNPLFDRYVSRARNRLGWGTIPDREAVRVLPRIIPQGHTVALLSDQGVKGLASVFVPFFGRPARTPKGAAVLALRLDAACVFMVNPMEPDGKYRMRIEPVTVVNTGDRDADVEATVAGYTQQLEKWARRYPEQYLWQHRRWRRRPDGTTEDY